MYACEEPKPDEPPAPIPNTDPPQKPNYTLRVIFVLFILLTDICLAYYIYVTRLEFNVFIANSEKIESREEIIKIVMDACRCNSSSNNPDDVIPQDGGIVEFFNPMNKTELQEKDNWVLLTNYCRVSMTSIQGYCNAAVKYCPVSPPGKKGDNGIPGKEGTAGPAGRDGRNGTNGLAGPTGLPGQKGEAGSIGIQGVKGQKGENGLKGIQGQKGLTGSWGYKGQQGENGLKGIQGLAGPTGLPGQKGEPGIGIQGSPLSKGERGLVG